MVPFRHMASPSSSPQGTRSQRSSRSQSPRASQVTTGQARPPYAPARPSDLRHVHGPHGTPKGGQRGMSPDNAVAAVDTHQAITIDDEGAHPLDQNRSDPTEPEQHAVEVRGDLAEPVAVSARKHLLTHQEWDHVPAHEGPCDHGILSPQPRPHRHTESVYSNSPSLGFGGSPGTGERAGGDASLGASVAEGLLGGGPKISTTAWLAKRHGVKSTRKMYVCGVRPVVGFVITPMGRKGS